MSHSAYHSTVFEGATAQRVWNVVRDFNSYPIDRSFTYESRR